ESFILVLIISVLAGLVGSWGLYFVGRGFGGVLLKKYMEKFPKQKEIINKNVEKLQEKGCIWVFISKLLPMVRTIISIPAGLLKMNFLKYTLSSAIGVLIWNFVFVGAGYYFGEGILSKFI
ncbi:MAG: DedA family protein, partial [Clostridium sp.]